MQARTHYFVAGLLLVAVVFTYANHFNNSFHFDDSHAIVSNIYIRSLGNLPAFFLDATKSTPNPANQAYRPIVPASCAIDYWLGNGLNPFYFHLSIFSLFLLQGMLMYFMYLHLFNLSSRHERNKYVALFAVAWYLLHPANAETINYMLARSDSISTLFVVLAFVLFLCSPLCRKWQLYLIPVALGGLTKPTAVMFGPLLLACVLLFEKQVDLINIFKKGNWAPIIASAKTSAPALIFCALMFAFTSSMDSKTMVQGGGSSFNYLITQPYVLLHYFGTLFLPVRLSADTDLRPLATITDVRFIIGLSFVLILFGMALLASKKEKLYPIAFGILWFFIALLPTSSFIPIAEVMNDHRVFFPYVGLVMAVAWAAALLLQRLRKYWPVPWFGRAVAIGAALALAGYAYGTHQRNEVWRTDETLWRDVTVKSPKNGRGWMNYGLTQMAKGAYPVAESAFLKAFEFTPTYSYLHINYAILKAAMGKPTEAEALFVKALALGDGKQAVPYIFYGRFLVQQQRWKEAVPLLRRALELAPASPEARYQLMSAYEQENDLQALSDLAGETLRIDPNDTTARAVLAALAARKANPGQPQYGSILEQTPEALLNLSLKNYQAGDFHGCIQAAEAALRLRPDYAPAYNNICAAWNSLGEWDKAVAAGERAVALDLGSDLAKNNLAWARSRRSIKR